MALLEKGIPFDCVLISLQQKPDWYSQVNEKLLTPAARINGEMIVESNDIMLVRYISVIL
jgi:glutathione S-transferase